MSQTLNQFRPALVPKTLTTDISGGAELERFKPWLETMYFYCSSELYDLDRLKSYLAGNPGQREFIHEKFLEILDERPFTALDWEKYMNLDHESDEDLYAFLTKLYAFLFTDGPYPEGN